MQFTYSFFMIAVIHGEDTTASRNKLAEIKEKYKNDELLNLNGKNLVLSDVVSAFDSSSLFQTKKILIIERFFTGVTSKEKKSVLEYLVKNEATGAHVIFWEDKKLDKVQLKKLGEGVKEFKFALPALLFSFLDSFLALSPPERIGKFHQLLEQEEAELIYVMILRQMRNLIIAKDLGAKGFGTMPSWQFDKFIRSVVSQKLDDLISMYRKLLLIDFQVKTGQTPLKLPALLDLFFVSL
jgi:DNA polymerase III delta subunit